MPRQGARRRTVRLSASHLFTGVLGGVSLAEPKARRASGAPREPSRQSHQATLNPTRFV